MFSALNTVKRIGCFKAIDEDGDVSSNHHNGWIVVKCFVTMSEMNNQSHERVVVSIKERNLCLWFEEPVQISLGLIGESNRNHQHQEVIEDVKRWKIISQLPHSLFSY